MFYLKSGPNVHTEVSRTHLVNFLLLGLHDVGKSCIARLVQPEISREDSRKTDLDGLQASVNLSNHRQSGVSLLYLGGEDSLMGKYFYYLTNSDMTSHRLT